MTKLQRPPAPHPAESVECCPAQNSNDSGRSSTDFEGLAAGLKAIADPTRLKILDIVATAPRSEVCVCDLPEPLGLTQPTVSHHLKVLVEAGLLRREKRGVWAYFSLVPAALGDLVASIPAADAPARFSVTQSGVSR
ncbi:ArsR family transcriptional regulator [Leucobacter komagatae]|uniref:ArsR family transcriptional regulator n=1 Tax=Leucobacter komagatae TaxID=55969 RepID=A0A542XYD5_9MICO|nr:metalloregulator ArsR/SmtB family transcription factor [Leucobacter komagatae]TQL40835.1 ArsR family transcriptional regulator [Leucobacter komagatae]